MSLKILTIATQKHPFISKAYSAEFRKKTAIESVFVDTRINVIDAFSALVTSDSYNISRFFSPDFNKRLTEILKANDFDVIHLESLFMTPYISTIRRYSKARVILRSHNLEHLIWERLANATGNTAKRLYLKHLASKLKKYECRTIDEVDGIAAISFEDTSRFKKLTKKVPVITIPFGIDLHKYYYQPKQVKTEKIKLFHIGSMDWEPNKEAVNWLLDDIWPEIADLNITLHLAGRKMPGYISKQATDQLVVHGEVTSAIDFMNAHDVLVSPILSGSGMRVKIIEAMALGKAVITTSIGAEGIDYTDGENILIANTVEEYISCITDLNENPKKIEKIGKNARTLVENHYDNAKIMQKLTQFYTSTAQV